MSDKTITLVISDIDGTLITSNHEVTEATRRAAYASERDRTRASAAGFDAHLAKPIQLPALAAAINHVLHDTRESQIT